MPRLLSAAAAIVLLLALSGCAGLAAIYSAPKYRSVGDNPAVPPGHVLVVGRVVLDPPVQSGPKATIDLFDTEDTVNFVMTGDLSATVDLDAMVPIAPDEVWLAENGTTSFVPMPAGTRYLRYGTYLISTRCSVMAMGPQGGCRAIDTNQVNMVENVRIDIPGGAAAVYIGTIVFEHDGSNATRVYVRDDFRTALVEIDALGIPGISSSNVAKQLAEVVGGSTVPRR